MNFVQRFFWAILLVFGIIGFLVTWFLLPHQSEIENVWTLIFKLITYAFIIGSIAFFPNRSKYGFLLVLVPFFIFLGFIVPRISYFGFLGVIPNGDYSLAGEFYTILYLLLFPLINLTVSFAFRVGGGTHGRTIKISVCGMIVLFSGFLDIFWHLVNPVAIPDRLQYAHHIAIFFGRSATFTEGVIFALCHIPLFIAVLLLPLDKWLHAIAGAVKRLAQNKSRDARQE